MSAALDGASPWSLSCGNDGLFSFSICSRVVTITTETAQSLDTVKQSCFAVSDDLLLWVTLIYRQSMLAKKQLTMEMKRVCAD